MSSKIRKSNNEMVSIGRERKLHVLGDCFLLLRPDDLHLLLRPVRVRTQTTCAISGRKIYPGDYSYPCYTNPVRLTPNGDSKCRIEVALKIHTSLLPSGYIAYNLPTTEDFVDRARLKKLDALRHKALTNAATKLLKAAKEKK